MFMGCTQTMEGYKKKCAYPPGHLLEGLTEVHAGEEGYWVERELKLLWLQESQCVSSAQIRRIHGRGCHGEVVVVVAPTLEEV